MNSEPSSWGASGGPTPGAALPLPRARRPLVAFISSLLLLAVASTYIVTAVAVRLDRIFFPGNEIALPQAFRMAPGLSAAVPTIDEHGAVVAPTSRINVLMLGLDRRPSEGHEPTRTDSIIVLTLDPVSKSGGVLSIPRDLWVEMPDGRGGYFEDRINTAYRWGALNNYPGGGGKAVRDAIEYNFPQIKIDYTAMVDFASFIRVIDTLGGVDIDVTEPFRYLEPVSVDDRDGVIPEFKRGVERMTGERALYYSRFRDGPDGDFGRIRRQQQVMLAVAQKLASGDAFSRAPDLWRQYRDAIETDVPNFRVPGLALLAKQVGLEQVRLRSLGEVVHDAHTAGGADVLVANSDEMAKVVNEVFFDARLRQEAATIEVQNATARTGLARLTADYFVRRGVATTAVRVNQTTPPAAAETIIYSYRAKDYTAERLADWLGVPRSSVRIVREGPPRPESADLVVILGRDAKAPAAPASSLSLR